MRAQTGNTHKQFINEGKIGPEANKILESHIQAEKTKRSTPRNGAPTIAPVTTTEIGTIDPYDLSQIITYVAATARSVLVAPSVAQHAPITATGSNSVQILASEDEYCQYEQFR
jgi:hypothetical protein